jgi:hypothetical protein
MGRCKCALKSMEVGVMSGLVRSCGRRPCIMPIDEEPHVARCSPGG